VTTAVRALTPSTWAAVAFSACAVSLLLTWASIRYARQKRLIDEPGHRRSHVVPTPRGGGIGLVVAVLAGLPVMALMAGEGGDRAALWALLAAIAVVAAVGWIDDHGGLGVGWRLLAHGIAAVLLALPSLGLVLADLDTNPFIIWVAMAWLVFAIAIVASINLHNFMDGIDGLLALQALFVFGVLAWICQAAGRSGEAQVMGLFAVATLGFVPFNFPRARIFMGDVGSGVLGLLIAVAVFWQVAAVPGQRWAGFIAGSAFLVDSSLTLASRVVSGRRWYSAHREHLYQWLVRAGFSHVQVVGIYMGWNLVVALPVILWLQSAGSASVDRDGWATLLVFGLACALWVAGKRHCRRLIRRKSETA
jgi:UDP-N-acetylmuramyl pentapeptide phosphotransferase/UDP-N-acetylglucosamine-1-phosphate transferase